MNFLIVIILFVRIMTVMSYQQCDCSTLTFLQQLVQQEMFERKLEISMLRSEMRNTSTVPKLLETNPSEDVHSRIEKLEQRFSMLENTSGIGQEEEHAKSHRQTGTRKNYEENESFETLVKKTLRNEKLERVKFSSRVENQIENLNRIVSDFKNSTDMFINEQARSLLVEYEHFEKNISQQFSDFKKSLELRVEEQINKMTSGIENLKDDINQIEQNSSMTLDVFSQSVTSDLKESHQQTQSIFNEIIDNVTGVSESVNECIAAIGSLKVDLNDNKIAVDSVSESVADLSTQVDKHLKDAEWKFNSIATTVGFYFDAGGVNLWKRHGSKWYHYSTEAKTWLGAVEKCRELNGGIVTIESKDENDYITADIQSRSSSFWIGLHDRSWESNWWWILTRGVEYRLQRGDFRNWAPGEPNDAGANEDCTIIVPNGKWNDLACSASIPYICER